MNTHPNDPLAPEERELARLMASLGPAGEPSPALDTKILAAAHAAVSRDPARTHKPRWPMAMGLAASVVFAVGIAWQLRPVQQVGTVQEAPMPSLSAGNAPEAEASAAAIDSPGMAADTVAEDAVVDAAPAPLPAPASPPPSEVVAPPAQVVRQQPPRSTSRPLPARKVAPVERQEARSNDGYAAPPPAPAPPPPAPQAMPVPAQEPRASASESSESAAMADDAIAAEAASSKARDSRAPTSAARGEMKTANAAALREQDGTTLDRVEVTGSRLRRTELQVPVSDDAHLAVDDWLERVRTRYGLGDADAARRSLLLFVKDHPSETVPEDLEPLLDE